jgi:type IV pilus assembly protein PilB
MDYQSNINADISYIILPVEFYQSITPEQAWHYGIIPKSIEKDILEFYIEEGSNNDFLIEELEVLFGKKITLKKVQIMIF